MLSPYSFGGERKPPGRSFGADQSRGRLRAIPGRRGKPGRGGPPPWRMTCRWRAAGPPERDHPAHRLRSPAPAPRRRRPRRAPRPRRGRPSRRPNTPSLPQQRRGVLGEQREPADRPGGDFAVAQRPAARRRRHPAPLLRSRPYRSRVRDCPAGADQPGRSPRTCARPLSTRSTSVAGMAAASASPGKARPPPPRRRSGRRRAGPPARAPRARRPRARAARPRRVRSSSAGPAPPPSAVAAGRAVDRLGGKPVAAARARGTLSRETLTAAASGVAERAQRADHGRRSGSSPSLWVSTSPRSLR